MCAKCVWVLVLMLVLLSGNPKRKAVRTQRAFLRPNGRAKRRQAALRVIALLSPFNQLNFVQILRHFGSLFHRAFFIFGKVTQDPQDGI